MRSLRVLAFALLTASAAPASASVIWGYETPVDNLSLDSFGSFGSMSGSGAFLPGFLVPSLPSGNESGSRVARLGDTIYRGTASSGNLYVGDATTNADRGILIDTGFPGIANVATDGTFVYVASSHSSNAGVVNKYDTSGNLVSTVNVPTGSPPDGSGLRNNANVEGNPITFTTNGGDAGSPHDVYNTDGVLLADGFADPPAAVGANDGLAEVLGTQLLEYLGHGDVRRRRHVVRLVRVRRRVCRRPFIVQQCADQCAAGRRPGSRTGHAPAARHRSGRTRRTRRSLPTAAAARTLISKGRAAGCPVLPHGPAHSQRQHCSSCHFRR